MALLRVKAAAVFLAVDVGVAQILIYYYAMLAVHGVSLRVLLMHRNAADGGDGIGQGGGVGYACPYHA